MTNSIFQTRSISFDTHIYDILDNLSRLSDADAIDAGISLIDEQHNKIVEKYNELVNSLRDQSEANSRAEKFEGLMSYIGLHFAMENSVMKMLSYPLCDLHVSQHAGFIERINEFVERIREGRSEAGEMILYIGHWLLGHVLITDKEFEEFEAGAVLSQSLKQSPLKNG